MLFLIFSFLAIEGSNSNEINYIPTKSLNLTPAGEGAGVIIVFKENINKTFLEKSGAEVKVNFESIGTSIIKADKEAIKELQNNSNVESIEPDIDLELFGEGEIINLEGQIIPWGIERINAKKAWSRATGKNVKIAIIDTGIDKNHPDLNIRGGISFINDTEYWDDDLGHGTSVAGVIGALDNNLGIIGVAPEAELYSVKVMGKSGGKLSNVIQGIQWAIDNDMDIIVLSLGVPVDSHSLKRIVDGAYLNGITLVAASGKDNQIYYPAKYSSVIAVGSINENNELTNENGVGEELEFVAPGANIVSTNVSGYGSFDGTSMAAPHVAGVIALLKEGNPTLSNNDIRAKLQRNAIDLGENGKDDYFGYGLVNTDFKEENLTATIQIVFPKERNETKKKELEISPIKVEIIRVEDKEENIVQTLFYDGTQVAQNISVENGQYKINQYFEDKTYSNEYNISYEDLIVVPLYTNAQQKDLVIDAPWRIEPEKNIPLLLLIHDANVNNYPLDKIEVKDTLANVIRYTYDYNGYSCGSDNTRLIDEHLWYEIKYLDPSIFLKDVNNTIHLKVTMIVSTGCGAGWGESNVDEELTIKVDAQNYPKLNNWYCGDTHYHSIYTDTSFFGVYGELGAPLDATMASSDAIGLDWITVTDHSNSFGSNPTYWSLFKNDCSNYFKCLIGEEVNCDPDEDGDSLPGNHYLAYNITTGLTDTGTNAPSCSNIINNVANQGGFGYAAHPESSMDPFGVRIVDKWHNYSLPFNGLEVWNGDILNNDNKQALDNGLKNWTELLLNGRKIFVSAGSDSHGEFNFKKDYLTSEKSLTGFGRAITCVYVPDYSKQNIFGGLKKGNSYMGNNGALNIEISYGDKKVILGETLKVLNNSQIKIDMIYNVSNSCDLMLYKGIIGESVESWVGWTGISNSGNKTHYSTYTQNSYYRAECISSDWLKRAYTNPIWVEQGCSYPSIIDCNTEEELHEIEEEWQSGICSFDEMGSCLQSWLDSLCMEPIDGINITNNTAFCTGNYNLPNGVNINANNVIINCNSSSINGSNIVGSIGIKLKGENVTLINCKIQNYHQGINLDDSADPRSYNLFNSTVSNNIFGLTTFLREGNAANLTENNFDNTQKNILSEGTATINTINNWWGTVNEIEIRNKLYGNVIFIPYANKSFGEPSCTPVLSNTSWTSWSNLGSCNIQDKQNQSRSRIQYDSNNCGTISNQTFYEYQQVACNYCSENINAFYTSWSSCINNNQTRTKYYSDLNYNSCCAITTLSSDCHINNGSYANLTEVQTCISSCTQNWQCTSWSDCVNNLQTRTCTDINNCNNNTGKPTESQSCTTQCTQNWQCGSWSTCINNQQTRICTDLNGCNNITGMPVEIQSCTSTCTESWTCDTWSSCINGQQTRNCYDLNNCGTESNKPVTLQTCTCIESWSCSDWTSCSSSQQTRTCSDSNNCGTTLNKPAESQSCSSGSSSSGGSSHHHSSSSSSSSSSLVTSQQTTQTQEQTPIEEEPQTTEIIQLNKPTSRSGITGNVIGFDNSTSLLVISSLIVGVIFLFVFIKLIFWK